ncbi:MAG: hypothetical protein GX083_05415, partial [Clostridiales bacterium]|nr:hypothetical protein [Clostridiales bacterium]
DEEKLLVLPTNDEKTIIDEIKKCDTDNIYLITLMYQFESLAKYVRQDGN